MTRALRHNWISVAMMMSLIGAAGVSYFSAPGLQGWFMETSRVAGFALSRLTIEGNGRTNRQDILSILDIDDGIPLLSIDLVDLQQRIETLPWVKHARITRVLPGDLHIVIEERKPHALWQSGQVLYLIDETGAIITTEGLHAYTRLIRVVGESARTKIGALTDLLAVDPVLADRVKTAVRIGDRRWDLIFDNGVRVKLPEDIAVTYDSLTAWNRFIEIEHKHRLLSREVSVIDVRVPGRLVMRVTPAGHRMMEGKEWAT